VVIMMMMEAASSSDVDKLLPDYMELGRYWQEI
jgi:hypothetical protein